jgi:3-hydroxyisobutyrate dehydrogenase-like beta-hydroxyacid dehydrogenase
MPDLQRSVGFIGLGNMGAPMARNLLNAGFSVVVHDLRRAAGDDLVASGARWCESPRALAAVSDIVMIALPGPEQISAAFYGPAGLLAGAREGTRVIDVSTSTPECVRQLAADGAARGVTVVDAPLSGGVRGARKGTLTIMVGGAETDVTACLPVLRVIGEHVVHVGPLGSGHVTKLVNNYMGISNALASMEAVAMGAAAGVDPTKLLEVVNLGTGMSHMTRTLYPYLILKRSFDPVRFSMELAIKDVRLALGLAEEVGLQTKVGAAVHAALVDAASEHNLLHADMAAYITVLESATGVEVNSGEAGSP